MKSDLVFGRWYSLYHCPFAIISLFICFFNDNLTEFSKSIKSHIAVKRLYLRFMAMFFCLGVKYTLLSFSFILVALRGITDDFRIYLAVRTEILI